MLFKKKISVDDYCTNNLTRLLSKEQEIIWEELRIASNDNHLNSVDPQPFYNHLRAVFIQLMLIAVAKNCSRDVSMNAFVFVTLYLIQHDLSEIDDISKDYNQTFAYSNTDGVRNMVLHFSNMLTEGKMQPETLERLYGEFNKMMRTFFDQFKRIKLVNSNERSFAGFPPWGFVIVGAAIYLLRFTLKRIWR